MSGRTVVPIFRDGLYRCPECGYVNLLNTERICPRCRNDLDWRPVTDQKIKDHGTVIKMRQRNVLITAIAAFIVTLLFVPVISIYSDGTISRLSYTTLSGAFDWSMFSKTMIQIPVMGAEWIAIGLLTGISYLLVSKMD